jgi:hypothetical protein
MRVYGANGHLFGNLHLISLLFQPAALASPTPIDSSLIIANIDYIWPANINQHPPSTLTTPPHWQHRTPSNTHQHLCLSCLTSFTHTFPFTQNAASHFLSRTIFRLTWISSLLPMSFQCLDCSQQFTESRGLSTHLRFYSEAHRKWKEAFEGLLSASKRARYSNSESSPDPDLGFNKGTTVIDAAPEIEVLPESPPVSRSFSEQRWKVPHALKDYIPHSLVGLPSHLCPAPPKPTLPAGLEVLSPASPPDPEPEPVADTRFTTEPNDFGLYW